MRQPMRTVVTLVAIWSLLSTTFVSVVNAAMVGTSSAVAMEQRTEYVNEISAWLTEEDVKDRLVEMGVDPVDAADRVATMTLEELQALHTRIDEMPAGAGAIEIIGIVFLVLLILELVGVTNIFNKI